jgi:hypothetical protein
VPLVYFYKGKEAFIDLKNDLVHKTDFSELKLSIFRISHLSQYPELSTKAIRALLPFGSSYLLSIYWMHNMHLLICIYWMKPKFKMAYLINFPLGALFQPILHRFPKPQKFGANSNIAIKNIQIRSKYEFKMATTIKMDIHSRD